MRTLRTSSIAAIVERLRPRLHIDPVAVLPPEITSDIFSYLSPRMLLEASRASRAWRDRTLDGRLWKHKFTAEGWNLDMNEVMQFDNGNTSALRPRKTRSRRAEVHAEQRLQKRRAYIKKAGGRIPAHLVSPATGSSREPESVVSNFQDGQLDSDFDRDILAQETSPEDEMHGVESTSDQRNGDQPGDVITTPLSRRSTTRMSGSSTFSKDSSLAILNFPGSARLNYHQIYKQKRKLEENWEAGRYKSFQLPHRDHPEEAHTECVYTIQYSGKHLVSGSRDRTLRIWNLDTLRLIGKPLVGHTGSVLCLQFDDSEKEDIIISGSSDTDVILWRFSTGQLLKKIEHAHKESVLNLKFDERFLVTCSKDKTIKIWSRHELRPGDKDYPVKGLAGGGKCPAYIFDLSSYTTDSILDVERSLTPKQREPLPKYTMLMTLDSHGAAVNAIHIHEDQLVSASGDRSLKVWNIHTGKDTAKCEGHTKGIACVQYDGKRIVSGSSDNTIRIFDPVTQVEVACLQGHIRLVRTIQAAFADKPGTREDLHKEARSVDRSWLRAVESGAIPAEKAAHRVRDRNPGSNIPENLMARGVNLPPGGGGSRWGRIVSGSYDETVIIWKKAADGRWVVSHKLRQEQALLAAGPQLVAQSELQHQAHQQALGLQLHTHGPLVVPQAPQNTASASQPQTGPASQGGPMPAHQIIQHAMHTGAAALQTGMQNLATINQHLATNIQHGQSANHPLLPPPQYNEYVQQVVAASAGAQQQPLPTIQTLTTQPPPPHYQYQAQPLNQPTHPIPPHQPQAGSQQPNSGPPFFRPYEVPTAQPNARVFKLQFDARRIICCSQDPKIVGWDFANGDESIVEASRFFGPPL